MSVINECILCLDEKKGEDLMYNNRCTCKYYYHKNCWLKVEKNKCVMCNINYDNSTFLIQSPLLIRQDISNSTNLPLIIQLQSGQIDPVEVRIQIGTQQGSQQRSQQRSQIDNGNQCICSCCLLCFICLIVLLGILISVFHFK